MRATLQRRHHDPMNVRPSRALRLAVSVLAWLHTGCAATVRGSAGERDAAADAPADAALDTPRLDAAPDAALDTPRNDAAPSRCTGPLRGWAEVDLLLGGDYERLLAADAPGGTGRWLLGGGRARVSGPSRLLRVEVIAGVPRVAEAATVAGTEGWEPLAFATDGAAFTLAARGPTGEAMLARFDRSGRVSAVASVEALRSDLMYRLEADVAELGDGAVVAMRRLGVDRFVVERRDAALGLRWSEGLPPAAFRLRPGGSMLRTSAALYAVGEGGLGPPRPAAAWNPIGATRSTWVGLGRDGFELERDDGRTARGPWPGASFAGWGYLSAFESPTGVLLAGNVDLGPVLGWFQAESLAWVQVPRLGGSGAPYGDENAVGVFLLGIEIPRPEQPLRYWGCRR